jgi:hypothetical protein
MGKCYWKCLYVGFEVLLALGMKSSVFWDIIPWLTFRGLLDAISQKINSSNVKISPPPKIISEDTET